MAQEARLNLRMQKEIKLLLNDPPHGVSLNISEDERALSSLSSIEARIEGPVETIYSKGVFVLKIQIPERYPFQPPNVTFVTPIYHPNIDNGGRICLDILNLPPKGAWQPSLNIATVLTSIGLLLSEPNPDDGLMAEISREYKYNRQVFDKNARSWTEKYANPATTGTSGWSLLDNAILAQNSTQTEEIQNMESVPKASNKDCGGSRHKMRLLGQKLSLRSEGSLENTTMATGKQDLEANHLLSTGISTNATACLSDVLSKQNATLENISVSADSGVVLKQECQENGKNFKLHGQRFSSTFEASNRQNNGNLEIKLPNHLPTSNTPGMQSSNDDLENGATKSIDRPSDSLYRVSEGSKANMRSLEQKMLLKSVKPENERDDKKENMAPNHLPSLSGSNNLQKRSWDVLSRKSSIGVTNLVQQNPNTKHVLPNTQFIPNKEWNQRKKKLHVPSKSLPLKSEVPEMGCTGDKGYNSSTCSQNDRKPNELALSAAVRTSQTMGPVFVESQKDAFKKKDVNQSNLSAKQNATPMENAVVSDSEDSADECERPSRSRLSLMRRRLAGKFIG